MLIYENERFSLGSVSFKLPNGIGIDTDNEEISGQGFSLTAPDKSFIVQIDFKESDNDAHGEFAHIFDEQLSYELIGEIEEIAIGGLKGYKAIYEDESTLNEEYAFDLTDCDECNLLNIYVMIRKDSTTYDEAYKNRIVGEILDSIKYD